MTLWKNRKLMILASLFVLIVAAMINASTAMVEEAEASLAQQQASSAEAAIEEIRSEKAVIDMTYDPNTAVQWQVGVRDDGSKRYGFASYICGILQEHNLVDSNTSVRVVDIDKVNRGQNFRQASLGRVNCSTYEQSDP